MQFLTLIQLFPQRSDSTDLLVQQRHLLAHLSLLPSGAFSCSPAPCAAGPCALSYSRLRRSGSAFREQAQLGQKHCFRFLPMWDNTGKYKIYSHRCTVATGLLLRGWHMTEICWCPHRTFPITPFTMIKDDESFGNLEIAKGTNQKLRQSEEICCSNGR